MKNVTITIITAADSKTLVSRHRTDDRMDAIERAIEKHFGRRASLHMDRELTYPELPSVFYGQIGYSMGVGEASRTNTGRVRIDVE